MQGFSESLGTYYGVVFRSDKVLSTYSTMYNFNPNPPLFTAYLSNNKTFFTSYYFDEETLTLLWGDGSRIYNSSL
jgi:hypothetical protein